MACGCTTVYAMIDPLNTVYTATYILPQALTLVQTYRNCRSRYKAAAYLKQHQF